jgi:hypothetical protein
MWTWQRICAGKVFVPDVVAEAESWPTGAGVPSIEGGPTEVPIAQQLCGVVEKTIVVVHPLRSAVVVFLSTCGERLITVPPFWGDAVVYPLA